MHQMERFGRELDHKGGNFGKKHNGRGRKGDKKNHWKKDLEWSFNEIKQMSKKEQNEMFEEMFEEDMQIVFGRRD